MRIPYYSNLKQYLPSYYSDVLETKVLTDVEDKLYQEAVDVFNLVQDNQFVVSMDSNFISNMEKMLNINSTSEEGLEFRRARVLNRVNNKPPYNEDYLRRKLDTIYGKENYQLNIEDYTIELESASLNSLWYREGFNTIMTIKPSNMEYIHKPLLFDNMVVEEGFSRATGERFTLGYSKLGSPLLKIGEYEEVNIL